MTNRIMLLTISGSLISRVWFQGAAETPQCSLHIFQHGSPGCQNGDPWKIVSYQLVLNLPTMLRSPGANIHVHAQEKDSAHIHSSMVVQSRRFSPYTGAEVWVRGDPTFFPNLVLVNVSQPLWFI